MWSTYSRRIDPISRSTEPFCQREAGAIGMSRMPNLSDAELRAAGRHRSARQLPTYAKLTRKQLISGVQKRRAERTKPAVLSE